MLGTMQLQLAGHEPFALVVDGHHLQPIGVAILANPDALEVELWQVGPQAGEQVTPADGALEIALTDCLVHLVTHGLEVADGVSELETPDGVTEVGRLLVLLVFGGFLDADLQCPQLRTQSRLLRHIAKQIWVEDRWELLPRYEGRIRRPVADQTQRRYRQLILRPLRARRTRLPVLTVTVARQQTDPSARGQPGVARRRRCEGDTIVCCCRTDEA
mmetsp:Transcript_9226/g.22645  ORF Transcript_9226/g.22645 Transcript_9226/m.22645 type:complete len:216 (-) Transcript_9226:84-731(-)